MKIGKALIALGLTLAFVAPATPVSANQFQENCDTLVNDAGGKKLKVCVSLSEDAGHWWVRVELKKVTGYNYPYATISQTGGSHPQGGIMWSRPRSGGSYCEGRATGCNGGGNAQWILTDLQGSQSPYVEESDHYTASEIYCSIHGQTKGSVWWTQSDWQNGTPFDSWNFNTTSGDIDAGDYCIN